MKLLLLISIFRVAVISISTSSSGASDEHSVAPGFKIAFIGDNGINDNAKAVLELIRDERTNLVLHQGDFDYESGPDAWLDQLDAILGPDFPYLASVGNVDVSAWKGWRVWNGWGGYQSINRSTTREFLIQDLTS